MRFHEFFSWLTSFPVIAFDCCCNSMTESISRFFLIFWRIFTILANCALERALLRLKTKVHCQDVVQRTATMIDTRKNLGMQFKIGQGLVGKYLKKWQKNIEHPLWTFPKKHRISRYNINLICGKHMVCCIQKIYPVQYPKLFSLPETSFFPWRSPVKLMFIR